VPLVVFGHMHHTLRRQRGERITFLRDRRGTAYLNAACVPRHGEDEHGRPLRHFSWIHLGQEGVERASHRWYGLGGELLYEELLWCAAPRRVPPSVRAEVMDFSPQGPSSLPLPPVLERC